ncbi:MAG: Rrf2 family transcriptional regulator [Caldisericaceae bacterium]
MILTTLEDYAIKVLLYLSLKKGHRATVHEIAHNNNVSFPYILRICAKLREKGILVSEKGRNGGYQLSKDPSKITLKDIINAVNRQSIEIKCVYSKKGGKCKPQECISFNSLLFLKSEIDHLLENITLKDLVERRDFYANYSDTSN